MSVPFTRCFGGQTQITVLVHGESLEKQSTFPAMERFLFHTGVTTQYTKGIFKNKKKVSQDRRKRKVIKWKFKALEILRARHM